MQIKKLLNHESNQLNFRDKTYLGVEGCNLVRVLLTKAKVTRITLRDCNLSPPKLSHIFDGMLNMQISEIEELNLRGNCIGEIGWQMLKSLLESKRIKVLTLGHCYITATQLVHVIEGLEKMKGFMEQINLGGNLIARKELDHFKKKTNGKIIELEVYGG